MGCGHETEIMDNSENWISTFLHHPVLHEPGTFYKYNTTIQPELTCWLPF